MNSVNRAHWTFHIISIALIAGLTILLGSQPLDMTEPTEAENMYNEVNITDTKDFFSENQTSLAEAVLLIPNSEQIMAGWKIADDLYWIWTRPVVQVGTPLETSWTVNVTEGKANKYSERRYGPSGGFVDTSFLNDTFFQASWSGFISAIEYYNRNNGKLSYTIINDEGQTVSISNETQSLSIELPPYTCSDVSPENPQAAKEVSNILVNGDPVQLPETETVICFHRDIDGQAMHGTFRNTKLDLAKHAVTIPLPWGDILEVPATDLMIENITFSVPEPSI